MLANNKMAATSECGCVDISWVKQRKNVDVFISLDDNNVGIWRCCYNFLKVFVCVNISPHVKWISSQFETDINGQRDFLIYSHIH